MKRKRGHKKGNKAKRSAAVVVPNESAANVVSVNSEDVSVNDEESGMEVDTPSSTGTDQVLNVASVKPDGSVDKVAGKSVGRVKVKLKTSSKALESGVPTHSDTDKSSPKLGFERQGGVNETMEDSGNSSADMKTGVSSSVSKKAGSIKIKPSRMLGGSNLDNKSGNAIAAEREGLFQKEVKMAHQGSRYNKQELDSALTVIKKVMKMEAAVPFNEPVNPEALGIPDYFDIIDTPMDFGTICNNLENGDKYKDSEGVYKDVQYIWDNCCKYNNKGDAILDLMRRVKKNFMKYWTAAGLYTEQSRGINGSEGGEVEDGALSSQGKMQIKGSQSKMKNKKHGRRHKSDCLCAICVLKRRKREREANARMAKGQSGVQDLQLGESSPVDSPYGEDSPVNVDDSVDPDADGDAEIEDEGEKVKGEVSSQQHSHMEETHEEEEEEEEEEEDEEEDEDEDEEENEMKTDNKDEGETKEQSQLRDRLSEEPSQKSQLETVEKSGAVALNQKGSTPTQNEEESKAVQQQRDKESQEKQQRAKMLESFRLENPLLLNLCGVLFPKNQKSVWSGPHSLFQNSSSRTTPIHAAIESFMK